MRSESLLRTVTNLRWLPEGAIALTVGVLASAGRTRGGRRSCGWMALGLVGLALHLIEEPLLHDVWPQLLQQAVRP